MHKTKVMFRNEQKEPVRALRISFEWKVCVVMCWQAEKHDVKVNLDLADYS